MKKITLSLVLLGATIPLSTIPLSMYSATDPGAAAATPRAVKASDLFTNTVARGKTFTISRAALDEAMAGIKSQAISRNETITPQQLNNLERKILERLIQVQLLSAKATDADKATGKELAEQRLTEIKSRAGGTDEALETQLKPLGMTRSEFVAKVTEEAIAESVLKRELKAEVPTEEIKKFYDANPGRFEQPELVRAAHILFATQNLGTQIELSAEQKAAKKKVADDVLKRARSGEDFAKLAKEFSEDPGSKDKGGEYIFPRGRMVPEFEAAAFSLSTNQISDIITTSFGYHIIKLYEKYPARAAGLDDEVSFDPYAGYIIIKKYWNGPPEVVQSANKLSQVIRLKLEADEQQKHIEQYLVKLVKEGNVEILDESLKPVAVDPIQVPPMVSPTTNRSR